MELRVIAAVSKTGAKDSVQAHVVFEDTKHMPAQVRKQWLTALAAGQVRKKDGVALLFALGTPRLAQLHCVLAQGKSADAHALRNAGAQLCRMMPSSVREVQLFWPKTASPSLAAELATGFMLAGHPAAKGPESKMRLSVVATAKDGKLRNELRRALIVAEAVVFARRLGNLPGNLCTPAVLASDAAQALRKAGGKAKVLLPAALKRLKMGALLGVAQGSHAPARFIIMEHGRKVAGRPTVVLVGKGVTFDSGGISLKPGEGMEKMRHDKCGAAAVIGTMVAAARLNLRVHLVGLVPAVENMPGGGAQRPGDVVTAMNGKTIEVINTDAEGRLILADALCYAQRYKPQHLVDLATLTGAVTIALGKSRAAILGTDDVGITALLKAGEESGEPLWRLPLGAATAELMQGRISDLKNLGGREAGTITGAEFLRPFVGDMPWAHLDIAAVAWDDTLRSWNRPAGSSGFGVRLLLRWLEGVAAR
ncbi:MAG: leucyl aminopeptidase [Planctomycetes bacterium]|nr:leucyl aminopeptidase [Planctomycetota bacterium]